MRKIAIIYLRSGYFIRKNKTKQNKTDKCKILMNDLKEKKEMKKSLNTIQLYSVDVLKIKEE